MHERRGTGRVGGEVSPQPLGRAVFGGENVLDVGNSLTHHGGKLADGLLCHRITTHSSTATLGPLRGDWNCGGHRQVGCPQAGLS